MQKNILEAYPETAVSVYAVWLPMVMSDKIPRLGRATGTLPDKRVTHYWDKKKTVGTWFRANVTPQYPGEVLWDASLLYGPDATWEETPKPLIHFGRTIITDAPGLSMAFQQIAR